MSRYMVTGYKYHSGQVQESQPFNSYTQALHESLDFLRSEQYKVIVILRDSEGVDNPNNAGKFFLHRIVK